MKKIVFSLILFLFANSNLHAEIVNLQKDDQKFGEWRVFCETDTMMSLTHCKIGSKFYENTSAITVEPSTRSVGQFLIVVPKIQKGTFLQIRVDQNDLILSPIAKESDFGLISLGEEQKNILFQQMKNGDFLFFRFNIKDGNKEITAKISLKDFRAALAYHAQRGSK